MTESLVLLLEQAQPSDVFLPVSDGWAGEGLAQVKTGQDLKPCLKLAPI
jgi:hypothetical protein